MGTIIEWLPLVADAVAEMLPESSRGEAERKILRSALRYPERVYLCLRSAFATGRLRNLDINRPAVQCRVLLSAVPALLDALKSNATVCPRCHKHLRSASFAPCTASARRVG